MLPVSSKEALYYRPVGNGKVICELCPHYCEIAENQKGRCHVRQNEGGKLYTLVYGAISIVNVDPVEKKPLYHFFPGRKTFSFAPYGCNLSCKYCINWEISQQKAARSSAEAKAISPSALVDYAVQNHCMGIAYTYIEPSIFYELSLDTAKIAHEHGLKNIYKTNGYITAEPLKAINPYLDAANVDLKSFSDASYRSFGGRLQPVLDTLARMKSLGVWLEVTTLIIPGINDSTEEIGAMARFIAQSLGCDTPWHLSRFFPAYKMQETPSTPESTILQARDIGRQAGVRYVYCSNLSQKGYKDTLCHHCRNPLVTRLGHQIVVNKVKDRRCPICQTVLAGRFE